MNPYQIVDLVVLAVLLYCAVKGASRGLMSQLAWVVALLLCFKFSGSLAPAIEPMIAVEPPLKQWIAMLVIYVGLCGVTFVASGMLSSWMEKARIIDFDKHLGGILGFVKGVVICMTAMYFLITMSPSLRAIVSKTYSGYAAAVILNNSQFILKLVPEHAIPTVQHVIDQFNQHLQPPDNELSGATPSSPDAFGSGEGGQFFGDGIDLKSFVEPRKTDKPASGGSQFNGRQPGAEPTLEELLQSLPAQVKNELTQRALDYLDQTSAEQKQKLMDRLNESAPNSAKGILQDFFRSPDSIDNGLAGTGGTSSGSGSGRSGQGSSPGNSSTNSSGGSTSNPGASRLTSADSALLSEIAGIYSQDPSEMARLSARTKQYLSGVPGAVARRVLEDWHADAMGLNRDPDPGTDVDTRLDDRILRQLNRAGVSLEDLDRELRTRLSQR
ncbi:MAG: CvpA family protein [Planctomycetaceae bacterium]